jgi:hypothetical protein
MGIASRCLVVHHGLASGSAPEVTEPFGEPRPTFSGDSTPIGRARETTYQRPPLWAAGSRRSYEIDRGARKETELVHED